ncbi:hypothetical protein [Salinibacter ruber]|uniref:hypothetical protein n=1 Tax=Salinibacter ruber TaxID=146919 RepID=UPI002073F20F|nr:hypothetical protein [Salinibacter ruber]
MESPTTDLNVAALTEKTSNEVEVGEADDMRTWTVPHSADTSYLTHSYFRYIGKFAPQIASKIIEDHYPGEGPVLDPMVGGGTVLTEAVLRGIPCEGWDVNPVSRLISRTVSKKVNQEDLLEVGNEILRGLEIINGEKGLFSDEINGWEREGIDIDHCDEYFDEQTKTEIEFALHIIKKEEDNREEISETMMTIVLDTLRKISKANVKKMNVEIDESKTNKKTLLEAFKKRFDKIQEINSSLPGIFSEGLSKVREQNAMDWDTEDWETDSKYGLICIHPPYLTNTAFSEATELQLALMGINHKDIWKEELRYRGSYLRETNGVRKYLVNWSKIIRSASDSLLENGKLALVVGDGQISYQRIPIGAISEEFAKDADLELTCKAFHVLNNNTGQTQTKRMKGEHVLIFEKS